MSLASIQEAPDKGLVLLTGPPGAGKSTFGLQVVAKSIAADRPVIFVTSDRSAAEVVELLDERGVRGQLGLTFVDAFTETVGLTCGQRPDTVCANCADLNSLSIAITRLRERTGAGGTLLVFDSLTSPYLFSGMEVVKFMRLFLSKFASEGNSVLALVDEGCGKEEDLVAMMSVADGILRMEREDGSRTINVVKHPVVEPTRILVPLEAKGAGFNATIRYDPGVLAQFFQSFMEGKVTIRRETGDFLNLFWPNLAHWSGMLWDPKGFPTMIYELNKKESSQSKEVMSLAPRRMRLVYRVSMFLQGLGLYVPKSFSKVKDMKLMATRGPFRNIGRERSGIVEYLEDISTTDEHHFRVYENSDCWGFENVGAAVASHLPPMVAGFCGGLEAKPRDWNAVETKCIGLGDPYCEFKIVPGEIDELRDSLQKDSAVVERIHQRLVERLAGFVLRGEAPVERPRLGNEVHLHVAMHAMGFPHLAGERYRMAVRMGGARTGKKVAECLMQAGLSGDEAVKGVLHFLEYCKVGKVTLGETIRIKENCESLRTKLFSTSREPSCFFTTGFLNGLLSAAKKQRVREAKCIVAGDPYCEWEII